MTEPRPPAVRSGIRPSETHSPIDATSAIVAFVAAWFGAQVLALIVLSIFGETGGTDTPIGVLAVALCASWCAYLAGMWTVSDRAGTADPVDDFGIAVVPIDAIGLGIGVLAQLVVIRLVYVPLENIWPATFSQDEIQRNAEGLVDRAGGLMTVVLFGLVVIGAPVVEELFYRGLLQRSLLGRFNDTLVVVGVAAVFAFVHFRPVEFPGLFVFGLIVGVCAQQTGRLGMAIMAHIGFNLTGLVLVL